MPARTDAEAVRLTCAYLYRDDMIIYQYSSKCYRCGRETPYYTYLVFHEYDMDVTFPLDMGMVKRVYAEMPAHRDHPYFDDETSALNYPIKVLGDDAYLDKAVMDSGKFPYIWIEYSRQAGRSYAANHCPACKAFLGNYHLREHVTDRYLRPKIAMKKYMEL